MPLLHVQLGPQTGQTPDGQTIQVPPSAHLVGAGPRIQVTIGLAQSIANQLLQQGQLVPAPVPGLALIDTGASGTCIDDDVAQQLGLPVVDVVTIASASQAATQRNVYPVSIEMVGVSITIDSPRTIGATLQSQGISMLIGRDVLQHGILVYNGFTGQFTFGV